MFERLPFYSTKIPLSLLLGALMPLSFSPFEIWYLAPIILAIWLLVANQLPAKQFALSGFAFGMGLFCVGLWWVRISVNQFGGAPLIIAIFMVLLLSCYLSLFYALFGYLMGKIKAPMGLKYGLIFPMVGVLLELLRAHFFTGFPWLAVGYSLVDSFIGPFVLPIMGALLASFWVYLSAGLLFLIISIMFNRGLYNVGILRIGGALGIFITLIMAGLFWQTNEKITPFDKPISVALLQGNIAQDEKFNEKTFWAGIDGYLALVDESIDDHKIIIWPETAIPSYYHDQPELLARLRTWAELGQANIVFGIPREFNQKNYNAIVSVGKTQKEDQFYDKYRLLPFGEYIPLRAFIGWIYDWINIPLTGFSKGGSEQAPFNFYSTPARASMSICFEVVFGETFRYQARQSEFLINISNDAWFGDSLAPWQHLQFVRARSIELGRPIVRSTNTGVTAFIDHQGVVQKQAPQFVRVALKGEVQPMQGLTTYAKFGDRPWIYLFLTIFVGALIFMRFIVKRLTQ